MRPPHDVKRDRSSRSASVERLKAAAPGRAEWAGGLTNTTLLLSLRNQTPLPVVRGKFDDRGQWRCGSVDAPVAGTVHPEPRGAWLYNGLNSRTSVRYWDRPGTWSSSAIWAALRRAPSVRYGIGRVWARGKAARGCRQRPRCALCPTPRLRLERRHQLPRSNVTNARQRRRLPPHGNVAAGSGHAAEPGPGCAGHPGMVWPRSGSKATRKQRPRGRALPRLYHWELAAHDKWTVPRT